MQNQLTNPANLETSELIMARAAIEFALLSALLSTNRSRASRARIEELTERYRRCIFLGEIAPVPEAIPSFMSRCNAALFSGILRGK